MNFSTAFALGIGCVPKRSIRLLAPSVDSSTSSSPSASSLACGRELRNAKNAASYAAAGPIQARRVAAMGPTTSTSSSKRNVPLPRLQPLLALSRSPWNSRRTLSVSSGGGEASCDSRNDQRVRSTVGGSRGRLIGGSGAGAGRSHAAGRSGRRGVPCFTATVLSAPPHAVKTYRYSAGTARRMTFDMDNLRISPVSGRMRRTLARSDRHRSLPFTCAASATRRGSFAADALRRHLAHGLEQRRFETDLRRITHTARPRHGSRRASRRRCASRRGCPDACGHRRP